jgi:hypothetical protein
MASAMDSKLVRQTVTLVFNLTNGGAPEGDEKGVSRQLNIQHKSEEVIVRQVTVSGTANPGVVTFITCDAIRENFLCSISGDANAMVSPNSTFMITGPVQAVRFGFVAYDGTDATQQPVVTDTVAQVSITLEFRGRS